jgi:hypothetical protein
MGHRDGKFGDEIRRILERSATVVEPVVAGRLTFVLENGATLRGAARIEGDWLTLGAPLGAGGWGPLEPMDVLTAGTLLGGGAKIALSRANGCGSAVHALADVVLDPSVDVERRVREALDGLGTAAKAFATGAAGLVPPSGDAADAFGSQSRALRDPPMRDATRSAGPVAPPDALAPQARSLEPLAALCDGIGWPCTRRAHGALAVELDVPHRFQHATIAQEGERVGISTMLTAPGGIVTPACRRALGTLLLRANDAVRMVAAIVTVSDTEIAAGFRVTFGSVPSAPELRHAFGALSTACRVSAAEANVLCQDERVAREYLRLEHGTGPRGGDGRRADRRRRPEVCVRSDGSRT